MNSRYFFCYDKELSKHLKSNGYEYITRAKHYATNSEFTLFEYIEDMQPLIDQWNKNKRIK